MKIQKVFLRNLSYYFTAKSHALVHSNQLYTFYKKVFLSKFPSIVLLGMKQYQKKILKQNSNVNIPQSNTYGAGSKNNKAVKKLKEVLKNTKTSNRYNKVLFNLINMLECNARILEMGTSCAISSTAMALNKNCKAVDSIDANSEIIKLISPFLDNKIQVYNALFDDVVEELCQKNNYDMVFIDGDHRGEQILKYYRYFTTLENKPTFLVFDDINWSDDMLSAWQQIIDMSKNYYSIETFRMGIVWLKHQPKKMHLKALY